MGKKFLSSRPIEDMATNGPNFLAEEKKRELMEVFQIRGTCDMCVFYRNEPTLYCTRQRDCYPETRVLWRGRIEGKQYGVVQPNSVLSRSR